ncbi:aldose epimerase family protein [Actinomadura atramentaria]|uniref:aldose epimerase family protein n=1 Tax=Actinomadura atramentaria TaxID=1990 RepID=UPI0003668DF2|nr:aldose epimerase family protein [Actinomadura atramentaria]
MGIAVEPFGTLPDGTAVERYTLADETGLTVRVLTYGAIVQAVETPDRAGRTANVALGFGTLGEYVEHNGGPHFGGLIGRYANRIGGARFSIDDSPYRLAANNGPNNLHGGPDGFDRRLWAAEPDGDALRLRLVSPHGDQGFPGRLDTTVVYTVRAGALTIDHRAITDRPTVVNLTSHTYLNLAGESAGDVRGHLVEVAAARYLPVDETMLPLPGAPAPVAGTPFDLARPRPLGEVLAADDPQLVRAGGLDHTFVLDGASPAVRVTEPGTGRVLELSTTEPGVQVYTGNHLDGSLTGTGGRAYVRYDGLALETQHFPDSPNRPDFPTVLLREDGVYTSSTTYAFTVD